MIRFKSKPNIKLMVLILIIIGVISFIKYRDFGINRSSKKASGDTLSVQQATPTQNYPTILLLNNTWQSYTDFDTGFTLQYPKDWQVDGPKVAVYGPDGIWETTFSPKSNGKWRGAIVVSIRLIVPPKTVGNWWNDPISVGSNPKQVGQMMIDSLPAVRLEQFSMNVSTHVAFAKKNAGYMISIYGGALEYGGVVSPEDEKYNWTVYQHILKTFKIGTKSPPVPNDQLIPTRSR